MKKQSTPGRRATDGAVDVLRVNIALTAKHHQLLKQLAGPLGASAWIRQAIDKAYHEANETDSNLSA